MSGVHYPDGTTSILRLWNGVCSSTVILRWLEVFRRYHEGFRRFPKRTQRLLKMTENHRSYPNTTDKNLKLKSNCGTLLQKYVGVGCSTWWAPVHVPLDLWNICFIIQITSRSWKMLLIQRGIYFHHLFCVTFLLVGNRLIGRSHLERLLAHI